MNPATLPQDASLPHLGRALDEAAMAETFAALLQPQGEWSVQGCRIERIKYRPRRNCSLAYRLELRHRHSGEGLSQRVAARLCGGDGVRRAERAAGAPLQASAAGPALQHLPALDMVTWWWPNDAKLAATRVLADENRVRDELLPDVAARLGTAPGTAIDATLAVVQYVPEQRLCARVDLAWADGPRRITHRVFAKASLEPDAGEAQRLLLALQAGAAWREGRLVTPRALGHHAGHGLHWQQGLPGVALAELPREAAQALAPALGAQLAALHGTPVAGAARITHDTLLARLAQVVAVLAEALPAARADLQRAASRLEDGLAAHACGPAATLHGDLHPRNILADGASLALIDLDGLHRGPALLDLGSWQAEGLSRAVLEGAEPRRDEPAWEALQAGYVAAGGAPLDANALRWATAWQLLTERAWRGVVNLKPGRFALAPRLVALAADLALPLRTTALRC